MPLFRLYWLFCVFALFPALLFAVPDTSRAMKRFQPLSVSDYHSGYVGVENGAASTFFPVSSVSFCFCNKFCIKELMQENVTLGIPYRAQQFQLSASHFGYGGYGNLSTWMGYARRFGRHIAFGLRFYYLAMYAREYPAVHSITFDASVYARVGQKIGLGFWVYNPARLKYGITGKSALPIRFQFDFHYLLGKNLLLFTQVKKELQTRIAVRLGTHCQIRHLFLTVGVGFPDPWFEIGARLHYGRFLFGVECPYEWNVGPSPTANISIIF